MEMVVIVKESDQGDKAARADRHSHGTEIGSVESGAKPRHATDVRTGSNSAILSCIYKSMKSSIDSDAEWH